MHRPFFIPGKSRPMNKTVPVGWIAPSGAAERRARNAAPRRSKLAAFAIGPRFSRGATNKRSIALSGFGIGLNGSQCGQDTVPRASEVRSQTTLPIVSFAIVVTREVKERARSGRFPVTLDCTPETGIV